MYGVHRYRRQFLNGSVFEFRLFRHFLTHKVPVDRRCHMYFFLCTFYSACSVPVLPRSTQALRYALHALSRTRRSLGVNSTTPSTWGVNGICQLSTSGHVQNMWKTIDRTTILDSDIGPDVRQLQLPTAHTVKSLLGCCGNTEPW